MMVGLLGCGERAPHTPAQADAPAIWTVDSTPLRVIDESDGIDFSAVTGVGFLESGDLVVVDGQAPAIWRFPADGGHTTQVGRAGDGPGEYRYPTLLSVLPDGGFAINDIVRRRVVHYGPGGTFRADQPLKTPTMGSPVDMAVGVLRNGLLLVMEAPAPRPATPGESARMTATVVARDSTGALATTFGSFGAGDWLAYTADGISILVPRLLDWKLVVATSGRYVAIGEGNKYEVVVYDLDGNEAGRIVEHRDPTPLSEELRATIRARMKEQNAPDAVTAPERFAEFLPAFRQIIVDGQDLVWILPVPPTIGAAHTVAVYTHEGAPLASVALPERFDLRAISDTLLAGVTTDSNDVPSVRLLRLRRGVSSD
jgi:hypothetical protein